MSDPRQVKLDNVIIVYPNVFEAKEYKGFNNDTKRFTATFIVTDPNDQQRAQNAYNEAFIATFGHNGQVGPRFRSAIDVTKIEPFQGAMEISISNYPEDAPQIYMHDMNRFPKDQASRLMDGCLCNIAVDFRGYTTGDGGVRAVLRILQVNELINPVQVSTRANPEALGFGPIAGAPKESSGNPFGNGQQPQQNQQQQNNWQQPQQNQQQQNNWQQPQQNQQQSEPQQNTGQRQLKDPSKPWLGYV